MEGRMVKKYLGKWKLLRLHEMLINSDLSETDYGSMD
jgi:hypothetical protein